MTMINSKWFGGINKQVRLDPDNTPRLQAGERENAAGGALAKMFFPFLVCASTIILGLFLYLRLHGIDLIAWIQSPAAIGLPSDFEFIGNANWGSVIEVAFGAGIATTLRWVKTGLVSSRRTGFNPWRHLIYWAADLLATPIIAVVIIYCLRFLRLNLGKNSEFSLDSAGVGLFIVLGFLLGFTRYAPRVILVRIWDQTLGHYSKKKRTKPRRHKSEKKITVSKLANEP